VVIPWDRQTVNWRGLADQLSGGEEQILDVEGYRVSLNWINVLRVWQVVKDKMETYLLSKAVTREREKIKFAPQIKILKWKFESNLKSVKLYTLSIPSGSSYHLHIYKSFEFPKN
jgi:hypothetical protein